MTVFNLSKLAMAAAMAVLAGQAVAQSAVNPRQPAVAATAARRVIVVSLEDRKLALVEDGQVKKVYPSRWASLQRRAR